MTAIPNKKMTTADFFMIIPCIIISVWNAISNADGRRGALLLLLLCGSGTVKGMTMDSIKLGDPVAARTEWTPAKKAGNAFFTHELQQVAPDRIELRAAAKAKVMFQAILVTGLVILAALVLYVVRKGLSSVSMEAALGTCVLGVTLVAIGWGMIRLEMGPVVFDLKKSWCWKGTAEPQDTWENVTPKNSLRIADIHALQILAKTWSGRNEAHRTFTSYELNLVRSDGQRLNAMDHGDLNALQSQAQALADFLQKPLWDASAEPINIDR